MLFFSSVTDFLGWIRQGIVGTPPQVTCYFVVRENDQLGGDEFSLDQNHNDRIGAKFYLPTSDLPLKGRYISTKIGGVDFSEVPCMKDYRVIEVVQRIIPVQQIGSFTRTISIFWVYLKPL